MRSTVIDENEEFIHFDNDQALDVEFEEILNEVELSEFINSMTNEGDETSRVHEEDHSFMTFSKHEVALTCCSKHPKEPWVVSGDEDGKSYVWNFSTGVIIKEITDHNDYVKAASFSRDGNYLAIGDLSGEIQCFKINGDVQLNKVWEYSMGDMCWMTWHTSRNALFAGSAGGEIYVWRIPSGDCKILPGNGSRCVTSELTSDGKKLFAGYGDGTVKLWDIRKFSILVEVNSCHPMGHKQFVHTVSCNSTNELYASGSENGRILFISNTGPVDVVDTGISLIIVSFAPYSDLIISYSYGGELTICDYSMNTLTTLCDDTETYDAVTCLKWLPDYALIIGTVQGNVYGYDARSGERKFSLPGHAADIYGIAYDQNEAILLTTSGDNTVKVFSYPG